MATTITESGIQPLGYILPSVPADNAVHIATQSVTPYTEMNAEGKPITYSYQEVIFPPGSRNPTSWIGVLPPTTATIVTSSSAASSSLAASTTSSTEASTTGEGGASNSDTSSAAPSPSSSTDSSSAGAIAGAAVGCLVGGLAIGFLIAYILLRRRQKQASVPAYAPVQYESLEKQGTGVAGSGAHRPGEQLESFLLDSKPDGDIAGEARSLNQLIQLHVENNYHLRPVQQDSNALAQVLVDLGIGGHQGSAMGPVHLTTLALDPRTRYPALRHIIAQAALGSSSLHSTSPISLLPQHLGNFTRGIPPIEAHRGSTQAVEVALTRWRQLSAFLLNPNRSERTSLVPTEDVSTQQAQQLATALNRFVGAFASRDREEAYEQENHLREVIVECAAFGYVLFSQPAEFSFRYQDGQKSQKYSGIVTFPGLEKIRDESGHKYPSPVAVTAPVLEL